MDNCLFCKIAAGEIPSYKIYEDSNFLAFLDINPVNLGHTLIIPRVHSENLFGIEDELLGQVGPIIKKIATAIKVSTGADGLNLGMNNGKEAGQLIGHSHLHLIPRFAGDGLQSWPGKNQYQPDDFKQTQEKITKALV